MSTDEERVPDATLIDLARRSAIDEAGEIGETIPAMAAELLRRRRIMRGDSRRAEQIRRMRWVLENMLVKIEALERRGDVSPLPEEDSRG